VTFETPLQPVVARRARQVPRLIAATALATVIIAAAHPWSIVTSVPGTASNDAAFAAATSTTAASSASASASPAPVPRLYGSPPPADRFKPIWSVVAVREFASGEYSIAQQAVDPSVTPHAAASGASTCDPGAGPDVGFVPGSSVRLLGAVVPNAGHGWIRLTLLDGSIARAFAVLVTYPAGTDDLAVGLFGVSSFDMWPPGGYRLYAVDDTGTGRYLYVCLGG
jgi:hypothetical protein